MLTHLKSLFKVGRWCQAVTSVCFQPVSAGHSCSGRMLRLREVRRPSCVTPAVASQNRGSTGSSTIRMHPQRAPWGLWLSPCLTPICTTSPVTWPSTSPAAPGCPAPSRTCLPRRGRRPPAVSQTVCAWASVPLLAGWQSSPGSFIDGPSNPVMGKASDAMWIFSTALCAVVGIMVAVGVGYQIHLDRVSKRKKKDFQQHQRGGAYIFLTICKMDVKPKKRCKTYWTLRVPFFDCCLFLTGYRRRNMVKEEREELEKIKVDSKETDV